jgi:hypothetical protein
MAVNKSVVRNDAYGISNPLQTLSPDPIIAVRNPTANDQAALGTLWVNKLTNGYFILTSISVGASNWQAQQTGTGVFASVDITGAGTVLDVAVGDTTLGGLLSVAGDAVFASDLTVNGDFAANGNFDIASANAFSFETTANVAPAILLQTNGGTLETIQIQSEQGTSDRSIYLTSTNGDIRVETVNSTDAASINLVANAGGFSINGVVTSAINVVGAGEDIQLNATGGSIAMTATESTAGAVTISASGVAGTLLLEGAGGATIQATNNAIAIQSGTGAINIGTSAAANTITVGNGTGASSVVVNCGTGALNIGANAIAHAISIGNNTGATSVSIQGGTGAAGAINIGSTANAVPITIGNSTGATAVTIACGTGALNIGANAVAHAVTVGNATAGTTLALNTPVGTTVSVPQGLNIGVSVLAGAGSPNGLVTAAEGSLWLRTDPAGATSRAYINTDAGTTWTNITCAA